MQKGRVQMNEHKIDMRDMQKETTPRWGVRWKFGQLSS